MRFIFALLGILLIATGAIVVAAPYLSEPRVAEAPAGAGVEKKSLERSMRPRSETERIIDTAREWAEKANAPLSILFGFLSLLYTRRTYHAQRSR